MDVLLLVSGGIDSPVAGHLLQAQGARLTAVHFSAEPFTDRGPEDKTLAAARVLGVPEVMVVDAGPHFGRIAKETRRSLYFVLMKRFMLRVSARLAREAGVACIATGENLGQVSSQTLQNLHAIDGASDVPVLRPLVGYDKTEIVDLARAIGTFELSVGPEVCDVLGPDHPATRTTLEEVDAEEAKLPLDEMVEAAVRSVRRERVPAAPTA